MSTHFTEAYRKSGILHEMNMSGQLHTLGSFYYTGERTLGTLGGYEVVRGPGASLDSLLWEYASSCSYLRVRDFNTDLSNSNFIPVSTNGPRTVAAWSLLRLFASNAGILGSNPVLGTDKICCPE
jgi:hypothetical protein